MGTTNFDALELDSTLTVDGAATITGALTQTGAAALASTLAVTGASTLTGAVAAASTLAVSGEVAATSFVGLGPAAAIAAPDDYATTYSWLYCDGINIKSPGIMLYDTDTGTYRNCYLNGGTLTAV